MVDIDKAKAYPFRFVQDEEVEEEGEEEWCKNKINKILVGDEIVDY